MGCIFYEEEKVKKICVNHFRAVRHLPSGSSIIINVNNVICVKVTKISLETNVWHHSLFLVYTIFDMALKKQPNLVLLLFSHHFKWIYGNKMFFVRKIHRFIFVFSIYCLNIFIIIFIYHQFIISFSRKTKIINSKSC